MSVCSYHVWLLPPKMQATHHTDTFLTWYFIDKEDLVPSPCKFSPFKITCILKLTNPQCHCYCCFWTPDSKLWATRNFILKPVVCLPGSPENSFWSVSLLSFFLSTLFSHCLPPYISTAACLCWVSGVNTPQLDLLLNKISSWVEIDLAFNTISSAYLKTRTSLKVLIYNRSFLPLGFLWKYHCQHNGKLASVISVAELSSCSLTFEFI